MVSAVRFTPAGSLAARTTRDLDFRQFPGRLKLRLREGQRRSEDGGAAARRLAISCLPFAQRNSLVALSDSDSVISKNGYFQTEHEWTGTWRNRSGGASATVDQLDL